MEYAISNTTHILEIETVYSQPVAPYSLRYKGHTKINMK